jgi:alpha-beta hydrolase superfamily lysophospholipase
VRSLILRGGLTVGAGLLALVTSACSAAAPSTPAAATAPASSATPSGALSLPQPTGPHPVGAASLHLTDTSRPDPWVPTAKARELMISLWYPTTSRTGRRAPYVTPKESELILKGAEITGVPSDALSRTRTNAFADAEPAGRRRSLPLVVLSPGLSEPRSSLTALAEDLASHGYAVVGIDHTYESLATAFPDGRVTTCVACEAGKGEEFNQKLMRTRAADVSFVLDELIGPHPMWKGGALIDPSRIAMAGHSAGGAGAVEAMLTDSRVRAGIDMDGTTLARIPAKGLSRPFLFLGTQAKHSPGGPDTTWDRDWKLLTGWRRWLVVSGAEHASFTNDELLVEQLGVYHNADLPGARALEITGAYAGAFFDRHLRREPRPLLDRPSSRYPEVRICSPAAQTCG